jgi:cytochrome c553
MRAVAQSLKGEDEIRALAGHLEQAKAARPAAESVPPAQLNAGRALYGVCIACHGNAGEGNRELQAPAQAQFRRGTWSRN